MYILYILQYSYVLGYGLLLFIAISIHVIFVLICLPAKLKLLWAELCLGKAGHISNTVHSDSQTHK